MNKKNFSIQKALSHGFSYTIENYKAILKIYGAILLNILILVIAVTGVYTASHPYLLLFRILFACLAIAAMLYLAVTVVYGVERALVKVYNKEEFTIREVYPPVLQGLGFIFFTFIFNAVYEIGWMFFFIPGYIWYTIYCFWDIVFIDQQCGMGTAFDKSAQLTKGVRMQVICFAFLTWVLSIISLITIVGIFFVFPAMFFARMYVYRQLMKYQGDTPSDCSDTAYTEYQKYAPEELDDFDDDF